MRRGHLIVVVAVLAWAFACSSASKVAPTPTSVNVAATTSSALPTTTAAPTTPSATVAATTSSAVTTTTPAIPTTEPPTTVNQLIRCETSSTTTGGLCVGITVPLPSDADQIIAAYLTFAKKYLEVQTHPDAPDWDGLLALVAPKARTAARQELEDRFKQGQILNAAGGLSYKPSLSRLRFPSGYIELNDCRADATYWADRSTAQPAKGEDATRRNRPFRAALERGGGEWMVVAYEYIEGGC